MVKVAIYHLHTFLIIGNKNLWLHFSERRFPLFYYPSGYCCPSRKPKTNRVQETKYSQMKSKCRTNAGGIKAQLTPTDCTFGPIKNQSWNGPSQSKPKCIVKLSWPKPKRTESQSNQDQDHFNSFQSQQLTLTFGRASLGCLMALLLAALLSPSTFN